MLALGFNLNNFKTMGLSPEEKEACADLYLTFTGGENSMPAHKWNDEAAVELYKMIQRIKDCTQGMEWIMTLPNLVPTNSLSTSMAAAKYLLSIWRTKISIEGKIKAGKINKRCQESHSLNYKQNIIRAAYGIGS
jgi:hypothetical protein